MTHKEEQEAELLAEEGIRRQAGKLAKMIGRTDVAQVLQVEELSFRRERVGQFGMRFDADAETVAQDIIESVEPKNG